MFFSKQTNQLKSWISKESFKTLSPQTPAGADSLISLYVAQKLFSIFNVTYNLCS